MNIITEESFEAKIFSINGTFLLDSFSNKNINMSRFSEGVYILQIKVENTIYTRKIITTPNNGYK